MAEKDLLLPEWDVSDSMKVTLVVERVVFRTYCIDIVNKVCFDIVLIHPICLLRGVNYSLSRHMII